MCVMFAVGMGNDLDVEVEDDAQSDAHQEEARQGYKERRGNKETFEGH